MRIAYGCSTLEKFSLITLTLKEGKDSRRDAAFVGQVWRELLDWFRTQRPGLPWFKVVELTKRRQPHLHVISGSLATGPALHCEAHRHSWGKRWQKKACDCWEHRISREWKRITGDSWVTDTREGYNPRGVAKYLGKYLAKGMHRREELQRLGFDRRWSCSATWPSPGTVEMVGTHSEAFISRTWSPGQSVEALSAVARHAGDPRLEIVGDPFLVSEAKRKRRQGRILQLEKAKRRLVSE